LLSKALSNINKYLNFPISGQEEAPRAYIALTRNAKGRVTEKDIQKWLEERASRHKWLTGGVAFVDEVPRLASGKIQRKTVKAWAKQDGAATRPKL
jgi:4-coumarate--CoA ligase